MSEHFRRDLRFKRAFEALTTVFDDPLSTTVIDPDHSLREERLVIFGRSSGGRVLAVMHTERAERVRVISAALRALLEIARRQSHSKSLAA